MIRNFSRFEVNVFRRVRQFEKDVIHYRRFTIVAKATNDFIFYTLPIACLTTLVGSIVCGYILIKLTGRVSLMMTFFVGDVMVVLIMVVLWVIRQFGDVFHESGEVIRVWKLSVGASKYMSRQVRSCSRLKIEVGPFFFVRKETRIVMISVIAYHTISLVISV